MKRLGVGGGVGVSWGGGGGELVVEVGVGGGKGGSRWEQCDPFIHPSAPSIIIDFINHQHHLDLVTCLLISSNLAECQQICRQLMQAGMDNGLATLVCSNTSLFFY